MDGAMSFQRGVEPIDFAATVRADGKDRQRAAVQSASGEDFCILDRDAFALDGQRKRVLGVADGHYLPERRGVGGIDAGQCVQERAFGEGRAVLIAPSTSAKAQKRSALLDKI